MESNTFQIILYVVFGIFVVVGFGSLALFGFLQKEEATSPTSSSSVVITVWGTLPAPRFEEIVTQLNRLPEKSFGSLRYVQKRPDALAAEYIAAIAVNTQPDLLLADHETLLSLEETLQRIPFQSYPLAEYQRTFIPASALFVERGSGYIALPFLADPMVLYYNENMRLQADIRILPVTWSEFTTEPYTTLATQYRTATPTASLIPLGSYGSNYAYADDLFSSLLLQTREEQRLDVASVESSLLFYSSFNNPQSSTFTWRVSLPSARSLFLGGRLLFYPSFLSEYATLQRQNPNLVVRVAPLPQLASQTTPVTPLRLYGFAVPKTSRSANAALSAAFAFLATLYAEDGSFIEEAQYLYGLPPAFRSLVPSATTSQQDAVFLDALFMGRVVPLSQEKRLVLRDVLQGVSTGVVSLEGGAEEILQSVVE